MEEILDRSYHEIVDVEDIFPPVLLAGVDCILDIMWPGTVGEVFQQRGVKPDHDSVHSRQSDVAVEIKQRPEFDVASILLVQFLHGGVGQQSGSNQKESVHTWKGIDHSGKQRVAEVGVLVEIWQTTVEWQADKEVCHYL